MADLWVAEVQVGAVTHTGPTTGLQPFSDPRAQCYLFGTIDDGSPASQPFPAIRVSRIVHSSGVYQTQESYGFFSNLDQQFVGMASFGSNTGAPGGTEFVTGGTLRITKDEPNQKYVYDGLLGSFTLTFASLPASFKPVTDGELMPDRLALQSGTVFDSGGIDRDVTLTVPWSNFFGKKNGTAIKGANLGSTDRGSWLAQGSSIEPWLLAVPGSHTTYANADTASAVALSIISDGPNTGFPFTGSSGSGARFWNQSIYLEGQGPGVMRLVDLIRAPEHGSIWAVYVAPNAMDTLRWRRTFDDTRTWEDQVLYFTNGTVNTSPNIRWRTGRLYALWHDGTNIRQSVSDDLARTWSTPLTLSITGTNPRMLIDPLSGLFYYFALVGTSLRLRRSADAGASFLDASPGILVTNLSEVQTVAVELTAAGELVVGYIVSNTWTQVKSRDRGNSWS